MILAIDMGNTNIVVGCIRDGKVLFSERMSTDLSKTALEYAIGLKTVLELNSVIATDIEGAIISSVVPPLTKVLKTAVEKLLDIDVKVVGPGVKTGLNILLDNPKAAGADLVVDAVAGIAEYGAPLIIIDMGTATTIQSIDKNGNYVGGAIIPGVRAALDSLVSKTSQLPKISLEAPEKTVGKNTIDCMKSGIMYGNAAMLDGMIDRMEEENGYTCKVIATGGISESIVPLCRHKIIVDNELLLKGLNIIYFKNI